MNSLPVLHVLSCTPLHYLTYFIDHLTSLLSLFFESHEFMDYLSAWHLRRFLPYKVVDFCDVLEEGKIDLSFINW